MSPEPSQGWIDASVLEEFPELRLWTLEVPDVDLTARRSPEAVRARLRDASDRYRGQQAIALRSQPIAHAHRVFFRHIGLDPDTVRPPAEALAVARLRAGAFKSRNPLDDGLTVACFETGIGVWAVDGDRVHPPLGIEAAAYLRLLDSADREIARLFADPEPGFRPTPATTSLLLYAIQVPHVPSIALEEALWTVTEVLTA